MDYLLIVKLREEKLELIIIECDNDISFFRNSYCLEDFISHSLNHIELNNILSKILDDLKSNNFTIFPEPKANQKVIKLKFSLELFQYSGKNEFILYQENQKTRSIFKYLITLTNALQDSSNNNNNPNSSSLQIFFDNFQYNNKQQIYLDQEITNQLEIPAEKLSKINLNNSNKLKDNSINNVFDKFSLKSSRIIDPDDLILFKTWFNNKSFKLDLLYSSEIHGENVETFHKKCDGIKNTLTCILTNNEKRIGGFSTLEWSSKRGYSNGTGEEFLFSLNTKEKLNNDANKDKAIYNNPDYFPSFGSGCDLNLYRDCFEVDSSYTYSNFQHSYGKNFVLNKINNCENYFTRKNTFRVLRMEIFKIYFTEE